MTRLPQSLSLNPAIPIPGRPHNDYHPIHNLPGELLALVFFFYIEHTIADFSSCRLQRAPNTIPKAYSWLTIRHVCRLWREVTLHHPSLHTHIVLADPQCVEDQIRRSGRLPLSIYAVHGYHKLGFHQIMQSCRLLFREAHRIQHVLFQYTASLNAALQSSEFATLELPDVRTITVNFRDTEESIILRAEQYTFSPFARMQLPRLQSYVCANGTMRSQVIPTLLNKPLGNTLRCLDVQNVNRFGDSASAQTRTIFDLLEQLSVLEELSLDIKKALAFHAPGRQVVLQTLKHLTLKDGYEPHIAALFLSQIITPPETHIIIESKAEYIENLTRDALALAARLYGEGVITHTAVGLPQLVEVYLNLWGASRFEFRLWTKDQLTGVNSSSSPLPLPILQWSIDLSIHVKTHHFLGYLSQIIGALPLTNTAGLLLRGDSRNQMAYRDFHCMEAFRPLTNVRVLGGEGYWAWEELSDFMKNPVVGSGMFPRLRQWHLYSDHGTDSADCSSLLERVGKAVRSRGETRRRIPTLRVDIKPSTRYEASTDEDAVLTPEVARHLDGLRYTLSGVEGFSRADFRREMMIGTRDYIVSRSRSL